MKTLPHVDVAIVGGGWTGLLMAKEIGSRTALTVAVLERGGPRSISQYSKGMDDVDHALRFKMMQDLSKETVTFRHSPQDRSYPMRQFGPFLPGTGVGGAGEHWQGNLPRGLPEGFELLTRMTEKYGKNKLPEGHSIQDWGMTFNDLEPFYARAEIIVGVSSKAGNLRGKIMDGGNPFEGPRSTEFPNPPMKVPYYADLFRKAATSMGYHPYPAPAAALSTPYTNPDGVTRPACVFCGYCERFGCMIGAKAQPTNTLLPVIQRHKNISVRTGTGVRRVASKAVGKGQTATGIIYRDDTGEEFFQPANIVILAAWTVTNTHLLYISKLGTPYNPETGKGTLGRNLTHQVSNHDVQAFFTKPLNRFMGSGPAGFMMSDLDGDVQDHSKMSFLGGAAVNAFAAGARPASGFGGVPRSVKVRWGSEWKKAAIDHYDRTASLGFLGQHLAYKGNFMDLDPRYTDHYGDPLPRLTINWHDNDRKLYEYMTLKVTEILKAMGAVEVNAPTDLGEYDFRPYQGTHLHGGTIMGASPESSVVNTYLQHWDVPNLFVIGPSTLPQNTVPTPTMTILAQTLRTADAIVDRYLKHPGALA